MAKGSVRRKGKKWYYRFYVEDASGNRIQKEFPGTESKSETESLLRKAMEDYETKMFLAEAKNITLGDMLDMWVEEDLKPGSLSNGTVMAYQSTVSRIKQHPIGKRKLKTVTADHLQAYMDLLSFGGTNPDGTPAKALSVGYIRLYSAVLQNSFRFAVFPKRLITFNPMQYVVRRSMRYNGTRHKLEVGATKRKKIRTVDFCNALADILQQAKREQARNSLKYGALYRLNYCKEVKEKNRTYYEVYMLPRTEATPEKDKYLSFVCLRPDGAIESPSTVSLMCRRAKEKVPGLEDFHFHMLRHTFTSNLLSYGAAPKDVQELLGHSDVNTTMNIYAHATREAKRSSARLLDKVVSSG